MKAVCIAGWSDSGKTTLIERLIPLLMGRGLRVGVVKHTHHSLSMDQHGSDTDRYRGSGAAAVVLAAPDGTALLDSRPMNLAQTLALMPDMDLILVEGFDREAHLPTLEVWRTQDAPLPLPRGMAVRRHHGSALRNEAACIQPIGHRRHCRFHRHASLIFSRFISVYFQNVLNV